MTETSWDNINSADEFVRTIKFADYNDYLTGYNDQEVVAFYVSNYMVAENLESDANEFIAYAKLVDRFFPDFSVHEDWGGLSADSGAQIIASTLMFNLGEYPEALNDKAQRDCLEAMRQACIALGIDVEPLENFVD